MAQSGDGDVRALAARTSSRGGKAVAALGFGDARLAGKKAGRNGPG
jgi:hypothetical protein